MLSTSVLAGLLFAPQPPPAAGISETLAEERTATLSSVRYELSFRIPERRTEAIDGSAKVRFQLRAPHRIVLDLSEQARIRSVRLGDRPAALEFVNGHLILPASATRIGENIIQIDFVAGDEALNRNDEFLYTLFVPARAHLAFPCFDQPSLKARYSLTLDIPAQWQALANTAAAASESASPRRRVIRFAETNLLPTYLFDSRPGSFKSKPRCATAAPFACFTARPMPARLRATATPSLIYMPHRFVGWKITREFPTRGANSILC